MYIRRLYFPNPIVYVNTPTLIYKRGALAPRIIKLLMPLMKTLLVQHSLVELSL